MKVVRKIMLAGLGAALLVPLTAHAADIIQPIIPPPAPVPVVEVGGGLYLRGDVGVKIYADPSVTFNNTDYVRNRIDTTATIGGGIGYKFNNWLRADITGDYEPPAGFHGHLICVACAGGGFSDEFAKIAATTVLANAYVDLGNWAGFTPYIGGGVGAAFVQVSNYHFVNPNGTTGVVGGNGQWNFAWAAMAGVSYDLTPSLALDLNYRYLSLGEVDTKPFTAQGVTQPIHFKDLAAHEVRLGLRYMFN